MKVNKKLRNQGQSASPKRGRAKGPRLAKSADARAASGKASGNTKTSGGSKTSGYAKTSGSAKTASYAKGSGRDVRQKLNKSFQKHGGRSSSARSSEYIEGRRAVAEALELDLPIKRALVARGDSQDASLIQLIEELELRGVSVESVPKSQLDALSSHGAHQGIVCKVDAFEYAELSQILEAAGTGNALIFILDHVSDQGNLGAIARSAEVVGASGIILPKARAASVGVGAYKSSAGAVLHIPIAQVSNLARTIEELQESGFWVCAATEHAKSDIWSTPVEGRLAVVMGSEGSGVSELVRKKCDFEAKLPQAGRIESLNVAQAATVFAYEWLRRSNDNAPAEG